MKKLPAYRMENSSGWLQRVASFDLDLQRLLLTANNPLFNCNSILIILYDERARSSIAKF